MERFEIIRRYLDNKGDKRKLVGAVAGGLITDNVLKYAHGKGLYAVVQSGESIVIAKAPDSFKAREW